jgi:hypothetical protein
MALTHTVIRQAKPKAKAYILNDIEGLSLYIASNGSKYWHFRFSWRGRQQRISFGSYFEIGLKDARELCDLTRFQVAKGSIPAASAKRLNKYKAHPTCRPCRACRSLENLQTQKAQAGLIAGAKGKRNGRQGTKVPMERYMRLDMLPVLGKLPMIHITHADVLAVQIKIEVRGVYSIAKKVRGGFNEIFRYAVAPTSLSLILWRIWTSWRYRRDPSNTIPISPW